LDNIISFRGRYSFLSNFYEAVVVYDGLEYPTVEHAYQAAKTLDLEYRSMINKAVTPGKAKALGSIVPIRDDWEAIKISVMRDLVAQKFSDKKLMHWLQQTAPAVLEERNYWNDKFWGTDLEGNGLNHLGNILMEIRDEY
jgi:ribA/ribD-fused uncharacterized protein